LAGWSAISGCHEGQADERIIAQWCDGFQAHVSGRLNGPFIILFQQQGADEADDGLFIGQMPTTLLRRLISPFSRSSGLVLCSLARCWAGKPM